MALYLFSCSGTTPAITLTQRVPAFHQSDKVVRSPSWSAFLLCGGVFAKGPVSSRDCFLKHQDGFSGRANIRASEFLVGREPL